MGCHARKYTAPSSRVSCRGTPPVRRDDEELGVLAFEGDEGDLSAVRAPANPAARGFSVREPLLMGPVDVHDMDVRHATLLADEGDAPAVGRDVGAVAGTMPILGESRNSTWRAPTVSRRRS